MLLNTKQLVFCLVGVIDASRRVGPSVRIATLSNHMHCTENFIQSHGGSCVRL